MSSAHGKLVEESDINIGMEGFMQAGWDCDEQNPAVAVVVETELAALLFSLVVDLNEVAGRNT
jgi:hypothetical protein